MYCIVKDCRSIWKPNSNIKLHRFPKDVAKRNLWLSIVPLKGKFYASAKICSLHFETKDHDPERPGHLLNSARPLYFPKSCDCVSGLNMVPAITKEPEPSTSKDHSINSFAAVYTDSKSTGILRYELLKENIMHLDDESPAKRPCLRDFNVQANLKTPREISLEKSKKVLQVKISRQQQKINSMEKLIKILRNRLVYQNKKSRG